MLKCIFAVTISLMLLLVGFQAIAQKDALVLYYTFDENSGDTVEDLSGNGNDGAINGAEWGAGKYGSALTFVRADRDFVLVEDDSTLNPTAEISYMAWFVSENYTNANGIISKYTGAGNQRSYNFRLHHTLPNALSTEVTSNGAWQPGVSATDVHSTTILNDGQWHHGTITFKAGDFLRMYVDGELVDESAAGATESLFDNNTPMRIGVDFNDEDKRFFDGSIDEVAVFNRALTEEEIQTAMKGDILAVNAAGKLPITWGRLKEGMQ